MTEILFRSDMAVALVDAMGGDTSIARAAQVSLKGQNDPNEDKITGLIRYLVREHHGSPFEHNSFTFYVAAPIFVFREFQRHRVGFSYNEMSGRYTKLNGHFYLPNEDRKLVNVGSSAKPEFAPGSRWQHDLVEASVRRSARTAWDGYEAMLDAGIGNEIARSVLPVNIYSEMYVTCNARSLMHFLALRTADPDAAHVSRPQWEIEQVARQMETALEDRFPIAYKAFNDFGRVAP